MNKILLLILLNLRSTLSEALKFLPVRELQGVQYVCLLLLEKIKEEIFQYCKSLTTFIENVYNVSILHSLKTKTFSISPCNWEILLLEKTPPGKFFTVSMERAQNSTASNPCSAKLQEIDLDLCDIPKESIKPEGKYFPKLKHMTYDETVCPRYPDQTYWGFVIYLS